MILDVDNDLEASTYYSTLADYFEEMKKIKFSVKESNLSQRGVAIPISSAVSSSKNVEKGEQHGVSSDNKSNID